MATQLLCACMGAELFCRNGLGAPSLKKSGLNSRTLKWHSLHLRQSRRSSGTSAALESEGFTGGESSSFKSPRVSTLGSTRRKTTHPPVAHGMRVEDGVAVRHGGSLGRTDSGKMLQRCNCTVKPDGEDLGNDSFTRIGFSAGCAAFGLSIFDSSASATELDPIPSHSLSMEMLPRFVSILGDLDPGTAQLATSLAGPFITIFNLLFIFRIVMSWYPGIPVKKFPFFLAYIPTEPVLGPTRRLIPPVGGVDVAPVIWVAIMSFANEILLGKQGLLVLLSQQQS